MNDKHENNFNRNIYSFNKNQSIKKSPTEQETKNSNIEIDFRRTTSVGILNTDGEKPLILYLKTPKRNYFLENKMFGSYLDAPNYISDGGLKQKRKKFLNLIYKYPLNYKFNSPTKNKKEIIKDKNGKYKSHSLSLSKKKMTKNRTSNEIQNYDEESNLFYKSSKKIINKNLLYNNIDNIKQDKKVKKQINNYIDNNDKLKNFYKKNLIKNLLKNKKFINKIIKNKSPNLIFIERKKQLLKRNGIDLSLTALTNGNTDKAINNENNNDNINLNNEIKNLINNKNIFNLKKIYCNKDEISKKKNRYIDQFEYIKKIIKEKKKIHKDYIKINNFIKKEKMISNDNLKKSNNNDENKNNINKKKNNREKIKNDTSNEETCDEYPFSYKKSHRDIEELKLFNKLKRIKQRKKTKEKEEEKKRKLYIRFKNLYKLNSGKINTERMNNKNDKALTIKNKLIKKRKEINKYYIGNEINKNNSTYIEKNDYYFSLYQSQQIITNSNIDVSCKINEHPLTLLNIKNNKNIEISKIYNAKIINKFISIIKSIFVKKIFDNLYHNYNGIKYYYDYYLGINYLIAIIKQYPFNKLYLNNLKEKGISDSGNKVYERKVFYFSEILTLIFKYKFFEKIFNYSKQVKRKIVQEKLENMFIKIKNNYLKIFFKLLIEKSLNNKTNIIKNNPNDMNNNLINLDNEIEEEKNCSLDSNKKIENLNQLKEESKIKNEENYFKLKKDDKIENNKSNLRYQENNKIIIKEDNDNDISAENDFLKNIEWEYSCNNDLIEQKSGSENDMKNELNEPIIIEDNDEYEGDFQDIKSFSENSEIFNNSNNSKSKNGNKNEFDENMNEKEKENLSNLNDNKEKNENSNKNIKSKKIEDDENFVNYLTEEIIKSILNEEIISSNEKIIPNKLFKNEINNNITLFNGSNNDIISKELNFIEMKSQESSLKDNSLLSLNNSLIFSSSTYSIFNKNIKDKKIENSKNFYMDKIFPKLIKIIQKELIEKHKRIYDNISTPFKNNSKNIMISLAILDKKMFDENYKLSLFKENLEAIINKESILKKFDKINNEIRIKDNISSDNYYDKTLNECIIDTTIELINKVRIKYFTGESLQWDKEENDSIDKYDIRNNPQKFALYICKSLIVLLNTKLGKNEYNILNYENINTLYDKQLNNIMKEELKENEKEWENLKIEETKVKLDASEFIFEMLLRENIEILEHIQNNRKRPDLYNYKSIYDCPNMPKLEFQKIEKRSFDDFEDDLINM